MCFLDKFFKKGKSSNSGKDLAALEDRLGDVIKDLSALEGNVFLKCEWDLFIGFVLSEAKVGARWDDFRVRRDVWTYEGFQYVTIGFLKKRVRDAGYDFSLFKLKSVSDIFGVLDALDYGDGLNKFFDVEVLKKKSSC